MGRPLMFRHQSQSRSGHWNCAVQWIQKLLNDFIQNKYQRSTLNAPSLRSSLSSPTIDDHFVFIFFLFKKKLFLNKKRWTISVVFICFLCCRWSLQLYSVLCPKLLKWNAIHVFKIGTRKKEKNHIENFVRKRQECERERKKVQNREHLLDCKYMEKGLWPDQNNAERERKKKEYRTDGSNHIALVKTSF